MRRTVELAHGVVPNQEFPSVDYLSAKMEEVEQDEPTASPLDEVTSVDESDTQAMQASVDSDGRIRITKTKHKGKLLSTTEEFRMKLRVEGTTWMLLAAKYANRGWLQGGTPADWSR